MWLGKSGDERRCIAPKIGQAARAGGRWDWYSHERPADSTIFEDYDAVGRPRTWNGLDALRWADARQLAHGRPRYIPCDRWRTSIGTELRLGPSLVRDSHAQELSAGARFLRADFRD